MKKCSTATLLVKIAIYIVTVGIIVTFIIVAVGTALLNIASSLEMTKHSTWIHVESPYTQAVECALKTICK